MQQIAFKIVASFWTDSALKKCLGKSELKLSSKCLQVIS